MGRKVTPTKSQTRFAAQGLSRADRVLIDEVKEELMAQDLI